MQACSVVLEYCFRRIVSQTLLRSFLGFGFIATDIINYRDVLWEIELLIKFSTGLVLKITV